MKRIKLLGAALIFAATALIPANSPAATCTAQQCFSLDCSQRVCPQGQVAMPHCELRTCTFTCVCGWPA
jgi:hypothetical protein